MVSKMSTASASPRASKMSERRAAALAIGEMTAFVPVPWGAIDDAIDTAHIPSSMEFHFTSIVPWQPRTSEARTEGSPSLYPLARSFSRCCTFVPSSS